MASTLKVDSEYGYVIAIAASMAFQCILQGFKVSAARAKYGITYPDMGEGRYATKLKDADWVKFMSYQRAHYNYVENLAPVLTFQLLGGLFYPKLISGTGLVYMIARYVYARGYINSGPTGRLMGARISGGALMVMFGTTVYSALKLVRWL
ncbi:hypothetical protein BKA69DRAFT_1121746 [Paraphysoderma sedebokerense]|nr:hypothetical protein BKA69DRAFT_1121746 [Paraphysoderma sedebokerense]